MDPGGARDADAAGLYARVPTYAQAGGSAVAQARRLHRWTGTHAPPDAVPRCLGGRHPFPAASGQRRPASRASPARHGPVHQPLHQRGGLRRLDRLEEYVVLHDVMDAYTAYPSVHHRVPLVDSTVWTWWPRLRGLALCD
ncbi:hypothetical protein SPI_06796 [Niveomyces insectorum RCEF 264]|uniref:Uncharacterized protein n=1 Tax=Niveomyces insectorum RCEF 264 TaxID=1081102 RepID=A0A167QRX9_9HYPO|nr:hypothetical protein SPI_06796 [Niveomyces insectorum RCEF 264]